MAENEGEQSTGASATGAVIAAAGEVGMRIGRMRWVNREAVATTAKRLRPSSQPWRNRFAVELLNAAVDPT